MIRRTNKGYVAYDEKGVAITKPYKSKMAAKKREQEVKFFKEKNSSK